MIGSGHIGAVRLRGSTTFDVSPKARFREAELSAYWSSSENADWEGALAYDGQDHRGRARITHIRRFDTMGIALTGEAATDGSVAVGLNLNFSLDAAARDHDVAQAAGRRRRGPRPGLSRPQRQWRPRSATSRSKKAC